MGDRLTRHLATRTSLRLGIAFLGLLVLIVAAQPVLASTTTTTAAPKPPIDDLSTYIVGRNNVDKVTKTTLEMWHGGDWVTLKGPITISVYNWSSEGHGSSTNKIKIESEKTVTIGLDQYSEKFPGDWNTTITLVSVDITLDLELLELIFGTSVDEVKDFGMTYGSWGSQASAMANGSAAASGFKNILGSTGKPGDFPNLDEAAKVFKGAAMLSTLVDDSGKALFPTFQNPGVQSLITTMCMNAAKDAKALIAVKNLMSLLGGMDMAKYTPPKP